ncbi:hypothetical protein JHK82_039951 [Glycine max]|nr:hypothetical protein JHK86_040144 [Glycine max]KAG4965753.1 hypothetical protein JHK85_040728 [Glycine max]KAG5110728.1 hypothetical protein JHK82_039951 [Glycine max]KAG5122023.1 hypothetical protein JHK84_040363 [Glycine max]
MYFTSLSSSSSDHNPFLNLLLMLFILFLLAIRSGKQHLSKKDLGKTETQLEKQEMIKEKCYLRFPTLPFIPKEPDDVIATDYDNFSLVSGAKDQSFIQIYSRTPNPGPELIEKYNSYLANYGYAPSKTKDTPGNLIQQISKH